MTATAQIKETNVMQEGVSYLDHAQKYKLPIHTSLCNLNPLYVVDEMGAGVKHVVTHLSDLHTVQH